MASKAERIAAPWRVNGERQIGKLTLVSLSIFSGFAMLSSLAPVQDIMKADLSLSDNQVAAVQGLAVSLPVALLALPLGRLTDRGNRVRLLIAMALVWTLGTALSGLATGFWSMFVARVLANIGAVLAVPIGISIASDLSSPERRGKALLPLALGKIAGQAGGIIIGGAVFGALLARPEILPGLTPWRGVQFALAALSALLVLPLFLLREPARREVTAGAATDTRTALREVWQRRALLAPLFLGQVTVVMADVAAAIWAPSVLQRDFGLTPEQFTPLLGGAVLISGIIGSFIAAFAADRGLKSARSGGILTGAIVAAAVSIPGAFFPLMGSVQGFSWMIGLLLLCGTVTGLVTATTLAVLVPNEIRGMCLGAFMVVGAVIGFGLAPWAVSQISAVLGGEAHLAEALAGVGAVTSILAFLGFLAARKHARLP